MEEQEFRLAMQANYFSPRKFKLRLSAQQVRGQGKARARGCKRKAPLKALAFRSEATGVPHMAVNFSHGCKRRAACCHVCLVRAAWQVESLVALFLAKRTRQGAKRKAQQPAPGSGKDAARHCQAHPSTRSKHT